MSDANGNDKKPETPASDAELLGPEKNRKPEPQRKEPPVIEGEAEEVAAATGAPGGTAGRAGASSSSTATSPAEAPAAASGTSLWITLAVVAVLVLGGAGAYFGLVRDKGPSADDQAIAALDTRLAALEQKTEQGASRVEAQGKQIDQRLADAEQKLAAEAQTPDSISAINGRLDNLATDTNALTQSLGSVQADAQTAKQKLDELQKAMPPAGLADQVARLDAMLKALNAALDGLEPKIDQMQARVAALEAKKDDPDAAARAALGLALANLARAAETPAPFRSELDAVASFLPNEPGLQALSAAAATGVPTAASLKEKFPAVVQSVFDAERRAKDDGLWARFLANLRSVVTVRRTGEISGDSTEAVIARMEERLKVDDLAGAVAEGAKLKGAAADAARSWLDASSSRVATDKLLGELSASVAARLAKAKG